MKLLLVVFVTIPSLILGLLDTRGELLQRQKRTLIFIEGVNWVQLVAGVGIPTELRDESITVGTVVKAFYLLPNNATDYTSPSIDYARKTRSSTRWSFYNLIESFFERSGYGDGKACLLRTICEVSAQPFDEKSGILSEIVHAILTPSSTRENLDNHSNNQYHAAEKLGKETSSCSALFPECSKDIVAQFTRFLT